jgi:hypothetical protein
VRASTFIDHLSNYVRFNNFFFDRRGSFSSDAAFEEAYK